jgi:hypothetical protein
MDHTQMKIKKILISALLIMAFAVITVTPLLADNILIIQDSYYYTENDTYITSQCATSAGEPQRHRAVAEASSIWETKCGYGNWHGMHSNASVKVYIGNHADSHRNYYELG